MPLPLQGLKMVVFIIPQFPIPCGLVAKQVGGVPIDSDNSFSKPIEFRLVFRSKQSACNMKQISVFIRFVWKQQNKIWKDRLGEKKLSLDVVTWELKS